MGEEAKRGGNECYEKRIVIFYKLLQNLICFLKKSYFFLKKGKKVKKTNRN